MNGHWYFGSRVNMYVMMAMLLRHVRNKSLLLNVDGHWYFDLKVSMYVMMAVLLRDRVGGVNIGFRRNLGT